jgi:SHS2 domain-containing protein
MKCFEIIDHPSDIGIKSFGKDLRSLFENAAAGMFSLITEIKQVNSLEAHNMNLEAENLESLLVNWLSELLYISEAKLILLKDFEIQALSDTILKAKVSGEQIDPKKHLILHHIKAVTYNQLEIKQTGDGWEAVVVFDV